MLLIKTHEAILNGLQQQVLILSNIVCNQSLVKLGSK